MALVSAGLLGYCQAARQLDLIPVSPVRIWLSQRGKWQVSHTLWFGIGWISLAARMILLRAERDRPAVLSSIIPLCSIVSKDIKISVCMAVIHDKQISSAQSLQTYNGRPHDRTRYIKTWKDISALVVSCTTQNLKRCVKWFSDVW